MSELVRYCDDFVIVCERAEDMETLEHLLKIRFKRFGLQISETKTHKTDLTQRPRGEGPSRRRISFLGMEMFRAKTNDGRRTKLVFKTQSSRFTRAKQELKQKLSKAKHWPVADQARLLNSILRGHFNYYGLPGNSVCIQNFYYLAVRYWRFVLGNRSQNGRLTWEYFEQSILQVNPIVKPRLKFTYTTLKTHAML